MYFKNLLACKEFLLFLKQVNLFDIEINEAVRKIICHCVLESGLLLFDIAFVKCVCIVFSLNLTTVLLEMTISMIVNPPTCTYSNTLHEYKAQQ